MRRFFALLFGLALGAGLLLNVSHVALSATNVDGIAADEGVQKPLLRSQMPQHSFSTAAAETVWFGYKATSTDPNKVGVGGKWDFDTGSSTSDSTQFWVFMQNPQASDGGIYPTPADRPFWYFDYGNNINRGNHNLWKARALAGRAFRRTGLIGVWHVDNMGTVPGSAGNLEGASSAWCGLRYTGDTNAPTDEVTGNPFTNAEQYNDNRGGGSVRSGFPGYANLWNQLLYRDFPYAGSSINLDFKYRCQLSKTVTGDPNGTAWFTPDPTNTLNMVTGICDSFMVWVGKPKEGAYDTNRRYLSEVIDFSAAGSAQPQKLFGDTGFVPADSVGVAQANLTIPAGQGWGGTVRVVFQVHTNRGTSDLATAAGAFNSRDGAVVLDDVHVGANVSLFNSSTDIRPRMLLANNGTETAVDPTTTWITTGRPPAVYGHVHSSWDLPYDDPCGGLDGSGARQCNLVNNIMVQSNHDDLGHKFYVESQNWAFTPVIALNGPQATLQGTPAGLGAATHHIDVQFDYYSGFDDAGLSGVFFWYGLKYMGNPANVSLAQPVTPFVANWSPENSPPVINDYGTPVCVLFDTDTDLLGYAPLADVDSIRIGLENQVRAGRFFATDPGNTKGSYWDNVRAGFVKGGVSAPAITTNMWDLYGDTFPSNVVPGQLADRIPPGDVRFDTTTALVKDGLNNGIAAGGQGVIPGDSLIYQSSFSGNDARVDLVFRVWPGPGNYSGRYHGAPPFNANALRNTPLWKVPSDTTLGTATAGDASWWGQYMANNGQVGSVNGHTATRWDPQTWNSARMDSSEGFHNYPIASRNIGYPTVDTWMSCYHESDPKFATLGIMHNLCFLVNTLGPNDFSNTCCDPVSCTAFGETWPPSSYPGAVTADKEGTKILPDGLFTPGTEVQYFVRRSAESAPGTLLSMAPDTTVVTFQGSMGSSTDFERYDHFDVLPDMWKDERFGGTGLACILYIDGDDRRGGEPAMIGMLDTLGFGVDNGAGRGWKQSNVNIGDPDNPAGFVPEMVGQPGLAFDKFDIRAAESGEGDRPGCRYTGDASSIPAVLLPLQCTMGPTIAMLENYYNTIIWNSGDLDNSTGTLHDGSGVAQEQSRDAQLISQWLESSSSSSRKAFWGSGDGMGQDLATSLTPDMDHLLADMGGLFIADSYYSVSGVKPSAAIFKPKDADPGAPDPFNSARRYGFFNSCQNNLDVLDADGSVTDVAVAARYEDKTDRGNGNVGTWNSSVFRRFDNTNNQFYATLLDGFSFHRLRAWNGLGDPTTTGIPFSYNDHARGAWMNDVLLSAFGLCARRAPVIGVGETPGLSAVNFVRGAFPNPSLAGTANVQFSLAQPAKVTIRFYNVAGRLVHEAKLDGVAGANSYRWNGTTSTGMRATAGVYFYRLTAPGIEFQNNSQRMVLLGSAN